VCVRVRTCVCAWSCACVHVCRVHVRACELGKSCVCVRVRHGKLLDQLILRVAVCCSVLQCVAARRSVSQRVLHCIAVRYNVLQCVAMCSSVFQSSAEQCT